MNHWKELLDSKKDNHSPSSVMPLKVTYFIVHTTQKQEDFYVLLLEDLQKTNQTTLLWSLSRGE